VTDHTKNLLIVVIFAGYASFVVADWYGYIKEPFVTLIQATLNPPAAVARAGFRLYKHPANINDWLDRLAGLEKHP
jgi:hypothetical protein